MYYKRITRSWQLKDSKFLLNGFLFYIWISRDFRRCRPNRNESRSVTDELNTYVWCVYLCTVTVRNRVHTRFIIDRIVLYRSSVSILRSELLWYTIILTDAWILLLGGSKVSKRSQWFAFSRLIKVILVLFGS